LKLVKLEIVALLLLLISVAVYTQQISAAPIMYTVQQDDSLYKISQRFGTTVARLIEYNNMKAPYTIYPGQTLVVGYDDRDVDGQDSGQTGDSRADVTQIVPEINQDDGGGTLDTIVGWLKNYGWLAVFALLKLAGVV